MKWPLSMVREHFYHRKKERLNADGTLRTHNWENNLIQDNLDIIHIENNVCDNVLISMDYFGHQRKIKG